MHPIRCIHFFSYLCVDLIQNIMIIDFEKIPEERIEGFKGGKGLLLTHNYVDNNVRIMRSTLTPSASSGEHEHSTNCEIIYILKGTMTFHYDGKTELCHAGQVHYCPQGHSHWFENQTDENVEYYAFVR